MHSFQFFVQKCGTLLYRLLNGELPDTLSTKVIWILIGTNDFGASHCSSESIAAGSIRIVQYIQIQRPDVKIVLNSILPRGKDGNLFASPGGWEELDELHHRLECFAKVTRNVEFFNATSMFLLDDGENQNPDYFEDPVHPSAAGHQVWGQAIVETVLELTRGHGN
jgi:lysophospholipase L1-like esterase